MKKNIFIVLLISVLLLPSMVFAEEKVYHTLNLDQTLIQEEIEHDFSNYQESDDQVTIYLFRGQGCGYCRKFLTFLNSIVDEYGKYFKVVSYEVWSDPTNAKLMNKVMDFMEESSGGVPFIVIGDRAYPGYSESYDDDIKNTIKEEYKKKNKYDVFEEMAKAEKAKNVNYTGLLKTILLTMVVLTVIATCTILYVINKKFKKVTEEIQELKKEIKTKKKATL